MSEAKPIRTTGTVIAAMALLLAIAAVLIVGLAVRPSGGLTVPKGSRVVHVDEHDFHIQMRTQMPLSAGNYLFVDTNRGPSPHELVMWKTDDRGDRLPLGSDHRVSEDAKELSSVLDSGSSLNPGETRVLSVSLDPGHYVVVCNLPGHYLSGMHVDVSVR
jgi:uncharacterized cupredoxin-like copper-binding protein